jgi:hypothetical protein
MPKDNDTPPAEAYQRTKPDFVEIGRVRVSDTTEAVLSGLRRNGKIVGLSMNKHVVSEKFTGFGKGVYVPNELITDFLKLFGRDELKAAIEDLD